MEQEVKVIKSAQCPSSSGKSKLTYEFGLSDEGAVLFRIKHNSGGGMFAKGWVPMLEVLKVLRDPAHQESIGSMAFAKIFEGRSVNTKIFLLAALKNEGVIIVHPTTRRAYKVFEVEAFEDRINALSVGGPVVGKEPEALGKKPLLKLPKKL